MQDWRLVVFKMGGAFGKDTLDAILHQRERTCLGQWMSVYRLLVRFYAVH